ncbi:MAG: Plug domain-containing protein, partial [Acidobacteriota bacterium]|nr:Plug domain-containing protein [Acidobacteriota bacterium]
MKKLIRPLRAAALAGLACLLLASASPAQEQEEESDVFTLGAITISVNVEGERLNVSERMETSVTRKDVEMFEKKDIGTALGRMPGIRYVAPSGRGRQSGRNESGVVVRGFSAFGRRNN